MFLFSNAHIAIASIKDISSIKDLLNSAYRGENSKQGWTTEAHLIAGDVRTNDDDVRQVMQQEGSDFLKYTNEQHELIGCVNLQKHGQKIYLGMFSVSPNVQGGGIGKKLLAASEEYASQAACTAIYMTVISVRAELIDWYKRYGYVDTGNRKPFVEDGLTGKHLQTLEFMVLEKPLVDQ